MARTNLKVRNAITGQPFNIVDDDNKTFHDACGSQAPMDQEWGVYDQDGNDISNVKLKDFSGTPYLGPKRITGG